MNYIQNVGTNRHGEEDGVCRVYALWPEGSYMSKLHYALSANASNSSAFPNEVIESWGGWKWNGSHGGVDLYGRVTSEKLLSAFSNNIKSKYEGGNSILTNADGEELWDDSVMAELPYKYLGIYVGKAATTLNLDGKDYNFLGSSAATYGYELYRLTKVLGKSNLAYETLTEILDAETTDTPIVAVAPGIVTSVRVNPSAGFGVTIEHTDKSKGGVVRTSYVHMKRYPKVQEGEYVGAGTILGYEGTTGASKGVHVHFEITAHKPNVENETETSSSVFPIPYLYPFFTPFYNDELAEKVNYISESEYMSTIRTVYPVGQENKLADEATLGEDALKVDEDGQLSSRELGIYRGEREEYGSLDQVMLETKNGKSYTKITNYTPTLPLVNDVKLLLTKNNENFEEKFLKKEYYVADEISSFKSKPYPLEIYSNETFLNVVARIGGRIFAGTIDTSKLIYDNHNHSGKNNQNSGKAMFGDDGLSLSASQWDQLEKALKQKVKEAGYGTRSGVVAAARFLAGMPYAVPYLGQKKGSTLVGSYPYRGLNSTWGQRVTAMGNTYSKNGFDCTAFVNWAMINGGVIPQLSEISGIYSSGKIYTADGQNSDGEYTIVETAVAAPNNWIQVGDWVYNKASSDFLVDESQNLFHIGIVIGEDGDNYFVAEESGGSLRITAISKKTGSAVIDGCETSDDGGDDVSGNYNPEYAKDTKLKYVRLLDRKLVKKGGTTTIEYTDPTTSSDEENNEDNAMFNSEKNNSSTSSSAQKTYGGTKCWGNYFDGDEENGYKFNHKEVWVDSEGIYKATF